jgi:hypothetical protein
MDEEWAHAATYRFSSKIGRHRIGYKKKMAAKIVRRIMEAANSLRENGLG